MGKAHKGNIHCSCLAFDLFCLSTQNDVIGADGFCNEKAKRRDKKLDRIFSLNCITGCKNIKVLWCFKVLYHFCLTIFYRALQKSKPRLSSAVERQHKTIDFFILNMIVPITGHHAIFHKIPTEKSLTFLLRNNIIKLS